MLRQLGDEFLQSADARRILAHDMDDLARSQ